MCKANKSVSVFAKDLLARVHNCLFLLSFFQTSFYTHSWTSLHMPPLDGNQKYPIVVRDPIRQSGLSDDVQSEVPIKHLRREMEFFLGFLTVPR